MTSRCLRALGTLCTYPVPCTSATIGSVRDDKHIGPDAVVPSPVQVDHNFDITLVPEEDLIRWVWGLNVLWWCTMRFILYNTLVVLPKTCARILSCRGGKSALALPIAGVVLILGNGTALTNPDFVKILWQQVREAASRLFLCTLAQSIITPLSRTQLLCSHIAWVGFHSALSWLLGSMMQYNEIPVCQHGTCMCHAKAMPIPITCCLGCVSKPCSTPGFLNFCIYAFSIAAEHLT